jgi:FkbM family methyltransferase
MIKKLVKSIIPYESMPFGLRKLVSKIVQINKPKNVKALAGSRDNVLNCMIAYNALGGYCTPLSSFQRPVVQQILKGRVHESDTIEYMLKNCGHGDIVHAGTYFGDFLPGLSTGISQNAKIWAFEPNLENYRCAQITILLNGLENVTLKNAGLGEANAVKKMLVQTDDGTNLGGASRIVNEQENGTTIKIAIVSIDQSVPSDRNVSVIQLDVEGYEKEALQGALNTLQRCKPILILEDNHDDLITSEWFLKNIMSLGYVLSGKVHMNTVLIAK